MTWTFLIATVAAFAITAPAQAQRADRADKKEQRAERAERGQQQRAERQRPQRAERAQPQRMQRAERPRPQRIERIQPQRAERPRIERQRIERPRPAARAEQVRTQRAERVRPQRAERPRIERQRPAARAENVRVQRAQRAQQVRAERQRIERQRPLRAERAQPQRAERPRIERQRIERQRPARIERQRSAGIESVQQRVERQRRAEAAARNRAAERVARPQQRQAERIARVQDRIERRNQRIEAQAQQRVVRLPSRRIGERVDRARSQDRRDWRYRYAAQRYGQRTAASPQYFYDYDRNDGYLYQVNRQTHLVTALFPLLGGAISLGQPVPMGYGGYNDYNVPYAYRSLYYDTPNYDYRYGDGAIYRVDQGSQVIQAIVALLTGRSLGIGQALPMGYDAYNVPYAYRDRYRDSDDMWYRYNDGYIYGVHPESRMIRSMHPVSYGGYMVGQPVPSYASYGGYTGFGYGGYPSYSAGAYDHLYYSQPGYNYQYANQGIYQVDPATQLVSALVALVTGVNLGVGQAMPMGYDVYNVPMAYRSQYYDTADAYYRYADGYIYEVDPGSRLIQAQYPVAYGGYQVGYPAPAAYPGYDVPDRYDDLYYAEPGYEYRYFDGGIYGIDPDTRMVHSQAALLTGQTFGVGQMLPVGYDAYNLPIAYRGQYYDTPAASYRYADGYIYQVDPATRLIQAVIDAIA